MRPSWTRIYYFYDTNTKRCICKWSVCAVRSTTCSNEQKACLCELMCYECVWRLWFIPVLCFSQETITGHITHTLQQRDRDVWTTYAQTNPLYKHSNIPLWVTVIWPRHAKEPKPQKCNYKLLKSSGFSQNDWTECVCGLHVTAFKTSINF